jgi:very-short-patch-repair endonuclease
MWVFHSVELAELTNPEDLRRQLLEYCYGVVNRSTMVDAQFQNPVPEDVRVLPFGSLFEQRVFNRIVERGFTVIPQFEVEGYRIDLVVVGGGTKVAVECDGDHWHGPERYEADLARMRDLERCDWTFFNIRESQFYVDRSGSLEPLWEMLETLGVRPSNWTPPEPPDSREPDSETVDSWPSLPVGPKPETSTPVPDPANAVEESPFISPHIDVGITHEPIPSEPPTFESAAPQRS